MYLIPLNSSLQDEYVATGINPMHLSGYPSCTDKVFDIHSIKAFYYAGRVAKVSLVSYHRKFANGRDQLNQGEA
jgi:7-cyano-7-deazaguanine synthase in queuosine biosynthesis